MVIDEPPPSRCKGRGRRDGSVKLLLLRKGGVVRVKRLWIERGAPHTARERGWPATRTESSGMCSMMVITNDHWGDSTMLVDDH